MIMTDDIFTSTYTGLRKREGRVYSDAEVLMLPDIDPSHQYYREWQLRKNSCKKLVQYINKKESGLNILEIGCGNGWLSAQLAIETKSNVTGVDINIVELEQAQKLFQQITNLNFIEGDIDATKLSDKKFDLILFAASIQYFESLKNILDKALQHLTPEGEIHIVDSKFYPIHDAVLAQERSHQYYQLLGFPEMSDHYFHHTLEELKAFNYRVLYNPSSWTNKILLKKNPFYWIVIKK